MKRNETQKIYKIPGRLRRLLFLIACGLLSSVFSTIPNADGSCVAIEYGPNPECGRDPTGTACIKWQFDPQIQACGTNASQFVCFPYDVNGTLEYWTHPLGTPIDCTCNSLGWERGIDCPCEQPIHRAYQNDTECYSG